MSSTEHTPMESIAIIGMDGRFPGAADIDQFWSNIRDGVESIRHFSDQEVVAAGADPSWLSAPGFVKAGAPLEDIELFDALFFGFSARDAEIMDPQQRVFLESAWHCLENAGYNPDDYPGLIGVYAGTEMSHYLLHLYSHPEQIGHVDPFQLMVANQKDHLTTTASYKMNLRGPSLACQTACSTSLVAVTLACHSLLTYQCDMALAGGSAICLPQSQGYFHQPGGILSPDGHCRVFDARAEGTVGGNGVALVLLKRLSEALADGDCIHAVIRGAAINNDGSLKAGYTAPSVEGQAQCIAMAQAMAGVHPETIGYVEAHGTATPLGDPIEIAALTEVFRASTSKKAYCAIGSVKSNVGHLNAAAGVAGLIKAALAVKHGKIPPSLHFTRSNPNIRFEESPFYVPTRLEDWEQSPRRAGVSSFGIGGTNAHVVLEQPPSQPSVSESRPRQVLMVSARTGSALEAATDNLADHLRNNPELSLADAAYTLQVGRKRFKHRRAVLCSDREDALAALESRDPGAVLTGTLESRERAVAFLFPGQGAQYPGMASGLYASEPYFREQVDACCEALRPALGLDLRTLLFAEGEARQEAARQLQRTELTQPALFVIEYAAAALWIKWGVVPAAMLGHSVGEYTAACLAEVISLEDALALVAERGRLMGSMPPGAMLATALPESRIVPRLGRELALAAVNSPSLTVVSGPAEAVEALEKQLLSEGVFTRRLRTSHAFHSAMMDPIVQPFVQQLRRLRLNSPTVPYLSNVSGTWITSEEAVSPAYYGRQLRQTVRYSEGVSALLRDPRWILLEVGPGDTLSTLARQHPGGDLPEREILATLPSARERGDDHQSTLAALGRLWIGGTEPDWAGFYSQQTRRRIPLPGYPFERQRYWIGPSESLPAASAAVESPRDVGGWFYAPSWKLASAASTGDQAASTWLVMDEGSGVGESLAARLLAQGHSVVRATVGERFKHDQEDVFSIRPDQRQDFEAMAAQLSGQSRLPHRVVHLWSLAEPVSDDAGLEEFERRQTLGFHSLAKLVQAFEKERISQPVQLAVVTAGAQAVLGDETLQPSTATLLGLGKVIPQEMPNFQVRAIDLALGEPVDKQAESIASEMDASFEPVSAYRKGRRWVQTFEATELPDVGEEDSLPLRRGGVVLITGGLGQIGLLLAEALAERFQAKLVLTGRSRFPERSQWERQLADDPGSPLSRKIRRIQNIESMGGEVLVARADASDPVAMKAAVAAAVEKFGAIHAAIHGAGNTSAEGAVPLGAIDRSAAEAHFSPKAKGMIVLEQALEGFELDFVMLLSSLSAILGGLGFGAYAASNAYLDAYAARRRQAGSTPWITVNWDAWDFEDGGAGAAASFEGFIRPETGKEAFLRILKARPERIAVSVGDLQRRLNQWVRLESLQTGPETSAGAGPQRHARPTLSVAYEPPSNESERAIAKVWEDLLGVAPIGIHDHFFELGGHSLLAIQVVSRLREEFRVDLPVQRLFESPTVAQLAEAVDSDRSTAPVGDAQLEEILSMVENLSDDEIEAMLEGELDKTGNR